jgi:hypothetical protein
VHFFISNVDSIDSGIEHLITVNTYHYYPWGEPQTKEIYSLSTTITLEITTLIQYLIKAD